MSSDFDTDPIPERNAFSSGLEYLAAIADWEARNPVRALDRAKATLVEDLERWWMIHANNEVDRTVPKAVEYGADDLVEIGREMVLAGVKDPGTGDQGYAELGVFFYEVGKMARWRSAVRRGEAVSDDTLFDVGVYIRMVQRIRSHGGWPGVVGGNKQRVEEGGIGDE